MQCVCVRGIGMNVMYVHVCVLHGVVCECVMYYWDHGSKNQHTERMKLCVPYLRGTYVHQ